MDNFYSILKNIKWKKILVVIIGSVISAYGIVLALNAGYGSGTMAVLWEGLSLKLGITLGQASLLLAFIMVAITAFIDRSQIHLGTIIYQIVYSLCVDLFAYVVFYTDIPVVNFMIMLIGVTIFPIGLAIYSFANYGRGSYEALTFALVKLTGKSIRLVRICLDVCLVGTGLLLGGHAGWCTLCIICLSGFIIQATTKVLEKRFNNKNLWR